MEGWAKLGEPVSLNAAYRAATKDIIQAYALGEGQRCLQMDDCNAAFFQILQSERITHVSSHFPWFPWIMAKLPLPLLTTLNPHISAFIQFIEDLTTKIEEIRHNEKDNDEQTIFHEILRSDIRVEEKSTPRLVDEAMVLAIAGADTTASTLVALTYHVLSETSIFARLRKELDTVMPLPDQPPDPKALDELPFLNALIEESLRVYPSVTHRQDRVAPTDELIYQYPNGNTLSTPAGTMVGMTAPIVNRHPAWYDKPKIFDPDRYLNNPKLFRRHLTFSKGMRQCLGMNLAYQELQILTAGIFRKYSVHDSTSQQQEGPTLELFETNMQDVRMHADYVILGLRPGSRGVRIII